MIWYGPNSRTAGHFTFCTILVMRAHSYMVAAVRAPTRMEALRTLSLPREQWMLLKRCSPWLYFLGAI